MLSDFEGSLNFAGMIETMKTPDFASQPSRQKTNSWQRNLQKDRSSFQSKHRLCLGVSIKMQGSMKGKMNREVTSGRLGCDWIDT